MKTHPTVYLLTDRKESLAIAHIQREAFAMGLSLIPQSLKGGPNQTPENHSKSGIIHLDSAWHLANQREQALQDLCEWVHITQRHAFHLPGSLRTLSAEAQDSLGKDLSMLASCREGDFLIVAAKELEKEPVLASLKLWLAPQVPLVFHETPVCEKSGEGPIPLPDLVRWFQ